MRLVAIAALAACGANELPDLPIDAAPSCGCQYGPARLAGAITPAGADELSGLAFGLRGGETVWAHNDGSRSPRLFALTAHGAGKGLARLPGATVTDWEDIAVAPCGTGTCIFVADTGDNDLVRTSVQILEVDEPDDFRGELDVTWRSFEIAYPDGPHDAEALFVDPRDGASYVIAKQRATPAPVFLMPRTAGAVATAVPIAAFTVPVGDELVTAADLRIDECGVRLLIRTYSSLWELTAPTGTSIADLLATAPVSLPVAVEPQGESVAYAPSGHGYITVTDGPQPVLSQVSCE